jgi:hypothetical protein
MAIDLVTDNLINVGDYRLHFRIHSGPGPTVLLESGGGANAMDWLRSLPAKPGRPALADTGLDDHCRHLLVAWGKGEPGLARIAPASGQLGGGWEAAGRGPQRPPRPGPAARDYRIYHRGVGPNGAALVGNQLDASARWRGVDP